MFKSSYHNCSLFGKTPSVGELFHSYFELQLKSLNSWLDCRVANAAEVVRTAFKRLGGGPATLHPVDDQVITFDEDVPLARWRVPRERQIIRLRYYRGAVG